MSGVFRYIYVGVDVTVCCHNFTSKIIHDKVVIGTSLCVSVGVSGGHSFGVCGGVYTGVGSFSI